MIYVRVRVITVRCGVGCTALLHPLLSTATPGNNAPLINYLDSSQRVHEPTNILAYSTGYCRLTADVASRMNVEQQSSDNASQHGSEMTPFGEIIATLETTIVSFGQLLE